MQRVKFLLPIWPILHYSLESDPNTKVQPEYNGVVESPQTHMCKIKKYMVCTLGPRKMYKSTSEISELDPPTNKVTFLVKF